MMKNMKPFDSPAKKPETTPSRMCTAVMASTCDA